MKSKRHLKILELIKENVIETQEELVRLLLEEGIEATQATVSRDIKRLGLVKISMGEGEYRYSLPPEKEKLNLKGRMERMFRDSVLKVNYVDNLLIIKTLPGTANGIASLIDHAEWPYILGTIAGDDTILIIVKPTSKIKDLVQRFHKMIK